MNNYTDFTGLYPLSKTLRFELRPQGKTMENIEASGFLEQDQEKADEYIVMKKMIDDYHRRFIDRHLSDIDLDWTPLYELLNNSKIKKDEKSKKELEKEQMRMRKCLIDIFEKDKDFKFLFNEKLFSKLLKKEIDDRGSPNEIKSFKTFNKFSGYFKGFHENRKNIYSNLDKHNSLAYRAVSENFPKYADNCRKYDLIQEKMPEVIVEFKKEIGEEMDVDVDSFFRASNFNKVLTQNGIDEYNTLLGGVSKERSKIRGLNEFLNLYYQKVSDKDKIKMSLLYKQILSENQSRSFIPRMFDSDEEVISSINDFYDSIKLDTLQRAAYLIGNYKEYDTSKIYLDQNYIANVSLTLFGSWEVLGGLLQIYKANEIGDPNMEKTRKKVDKWLASKEFTLKEIIDAIEKDPKEDAFKTYATKVSESLKRIDACDRTCIAPGSKFSDNELKMQDMKAFLDSILELQHLMRPFYVKDELDKDVGFYSEFNEIYEQISEIIPLYNKIRNYATRKKLSSLKIKMNFGNSTLANGWDKNKERENTAVIFIRNNKYYLGIMNPKNKIKFDQYSVKDDGDGYKKMVYKLLPGPNKMLPKVFFSKKGIKNFNPPSAIIEGYKAGKHIIGSNFDIKFCHSLIDFFKENIPKYDGWDGFDFKFSPTESYSDISQFYKEVADQGYKITFENIPSDTISSMVDKGQLFLFQIYSKDFSEHSKGRKNMHTLYWESAFSKDNFRDVVVKINGEAELFFRNKSDIKKVTHEKGTTLVNRTGKDGAPIPDSIYYELFKFKTGQISKLSKEAQAYKDNITVHEAKYDIVKDRRYTEDKMLFHIPITLNFKSRGDQNVNKMVIEHIVSNPELRIIGIDRGERNLLYVSMIDRKGNIIEQRSLNVIDGVDYHQKLDQREKERTEARKSWSSIEKIRDLKEGYLSKAVNIISQMVVKNNAIVILEDLNFGFKRGRFKVEKQVYQKFEKMLIDKLNYLVFKESDINSPGGVLKAYQLTDQFDSFQKLGKQSGVLFYVPAAYTSKVDPTTGFVDIFNTSSITRHEQRSDFLNKMISIKYNSAENAFDFKFDYRTFNVSKTDNRNIWTVSTRGERIKYNSKTKEHYSVDLTAEIISALDKGSIPYDDGEDLKGSIISSDRNVSDKIYYAFWTV